MTDFGLRGLIELLSPEDVEVLRALGRRKAYADGEMVHLKGDEQATMDVVVQGSVKLYRQLRNGQQLLTITINAGQHYADIQAFDSRRRTHNAVAVGHTIVDHYPHESFLKLLDHPGITRALYQIAGQRLLLAIEIADDARSLPPDVRLAKALAAMQRSTGGGGNVECRQEELASLLGVSAMTLAKAFGTLRREGLVETGYRYVAIPDPVRLQAWIEQRNWD